MKAAFRVFLVGAALGLSSLLFAAEKSDQPQKPEPVILCLVASRSLIDLGALLDAANRNLIEERIAHLRRWIEQSDEKNLRARADLKAWEAARLQWKKGDPIPSGIAYVVIAEEGGEYCVAYYPLAQVPIVCCVDKVNYAVRVRSGERAMKAVNLSQKGRIVE